MQVIKKINLRDKPTTQHVFLLLTLLVLALGLTMTACQEDEIPIGPEGPQGEQGPIGPAGEDGSVMYAGEGAPAGETGKIGDYYLNQNTGELYGPKDADGWGNPIIVLMGEDGKDGADGEDGQDGTDGQDGKDGSQIYSGTGAPASSLGKAGDFYLDKSSYELYGPKTSSGWGTPLNLKGADGNANVTRYIFNGFDFTSNVIEIKSVPNIQSLAEMQQSAWLIYGVTSSILEIYYTLPGYGPGNSRYKIEHSYNGAKQVDFLIILASGIGNVFDRIEIVRIEASNTVDLTSNSPGSSDSILPAHLNVTDYQAVAEYYGF